MSTGSSKRVVKVLDSEAEVAKNLCEFIMQCANAAIKDHGVFNVGFSGGSMEKFVRLGLAAAAGDMDWTRWRVFFCDERHVPLDHEDSNFKLYKDGAFSTVPLPEPNILSIHHTLSIPACANDYDRQIKGYADSIDVFPNYDLLLLGMGEDGHTCSLFPGHPVLKEEKKWVAPVTDAPKPPAKRVTITLPIINNARNSAFALCGDAKAAMLKRVLEGEEEDPPLPAAMVKSMNVHWFLDHAAASLLSPETTS